MGEKKGDEFKGNGNIPMLSTSGENIPEAWENSVVKLHNEGLWYYRSSRKDKGNLQVDSSMAITVRNPMAGAMHKYMTCDFTDLLEYQMEILGAKDSWVDPTGKSTVWPYHYHERLAKHNGSEGVIDQIEEGIIRKLAEKPGTRQANAITWVPERDNKSDDPPCLQRIWFSLVPNEFAETDELVLNMNYNFRSRNVMIAAPMNQFGLATLQAYVRDRLADLTGKRIVSGRMIDFSDSYHVSSHDQPILKGFMVRLERSVEKGQDIKDRSYTREVFNEVIDSTYPVIEDKIIEQTRKVLSGDDLDREVTKIREISKLVRKINESNENGRQ